MRLFRKITLSTAPFYTSLVVITSLALLVGSLWTINEYQAYQDSVENIRENYRSQYQSRLREELVDLTGLIDYLWQQNEARVERDIRERVQSAYTIASHNFQLYKEDKSLTELRQEVAELLRPIRWSDGRGYYFAGQVGGRRIDLFADEPAFEKNTAAEFAAITGQEVINDIVDEIRAKEAGLYRYNLLKPAFADRSYPKIAFVKYFQPLDWFIGAGIYHDDLEESLRREVLERIRNIRFGPDGETFCFRDDGTILSHPDQRLIGRSVLDLVDSNGEAYGRALLELGRTSGEGGFVRFTVARGEESAPQQKLSFIKAYRNWGWLLGASMSMDAMEEAIEVETATYQQIAFKNVFMFLVLIGIAVAILLLSTFFYSLKIKQGISLFTDFFRQAADANVKINKKDLVFREFEDLGRLANRMVSERIRNEMLLHRDELRLDSLLRLGMMEKYSLPEKYTFLLQRLIQITRSQRGYLALVDSEQSRVTLCAQFPSAPAGSEEVAAAERGRAVEEAGFPGMAVLKKTAIIANQAEGQGTVFPYRDPVQRHLDVPIYSDGKVVVVAGVCDNPESYDNFDIRQMTMLLEGLWMHMQKKASEEELARLERQIIAVSEEERSKIGRDLHDDLGSHLTGVELLSKVLQRKLEEESPERAEQLETIRSLIREAIDKTRRLSQGLYPVHVVEYGLEAAIEELVVEAEKVFPVRFDLLWEGDGTRLGKNTAIHLHYIIREAVYNAARHGQPKNIGIYVRLAGSAFQVKIVDDGVGFDTTPAAKGMGFHTMKYRAKAIGATLSITSARDGGTIITVSGEGLE
jgi:signal transduction histidine kinase